MTVLPPFTLHRPATLAEASRLIDEHGDSAAFVWGGTELLLLLKLGFGSFDHLVDLKGIDGLAGIAVDGDTLVVGGGTTHGEIERSALVTGRLPALAAMARQVANVRVRSAGTIGGNLCFADPHSDPATFLCALGAEVECRRGEGAPRRLPVGDFVLGPYTTALVPGEVLTAVRIPLTAGLAVVHDKLAIHERPAVTVTCAARVDGGAVADVRVSVGSVGPRPVRAVEAEALLHGRPVADAAAVLDGAGRLAAEASGAVEDANGSAEYKRQLVSVLVRRALARALA